jgi:pyridoxamine 5'-phosphate oxidase
MNKIADIRKDYRLSRFSETDAASNPIEQFTNWWNDAIKSEIDEVNAMTLATADSKGKPSGRIVLLKGYDEKGFVFFTNYKSLKGKELLQNPQVCLIFYWKELERQIKIEGIAEKLSSKENDAYFFSRPEGSKIGAWSSPQSSVIKGREVIEKNAQKYADKFANMNIPRPPHWGGYYVKPLLFEFWQGGPSRLHDRIQYRRQKRSTWKIERLAP